MKLNKENKKFSVSFKTRNNKNQWFLSAPKISIFRGFEDKKNKKFFASFKTGNFEDNKKSQGAIEFLSLFIAIFLFFVLFMLVIQEKSNVKNSEKISILANDVALSVQNEINLAFNSPDGYYREFSLPNNLFGKNYEINIEDNIVYVTANKLGISYRVLPVNGTVKKGVNLIKKQNGNVYLN